MPIEIPPLRDRREDIPALVDFLIIEVSRDLKVNPRPIQPDALAKLQNYSFPGNVRELRNLIERACILASTDEITTNDLVLVGGAESGLPKAVGSAGLPDGVQLPEFLDQIEARLIRQTLLDSNNIQAEAARKLGISRSDIAYKIKKHDL